MKNAKQQNQPRPVPIKVMVTADERQELQKAADLAGMALSVYLRAMALAAARRKAA